MKRTLLVIILLLIVAAIAFSQQPPKKLYKGWYTFKQLQRRGYTCPKFKGAVYIRPTSDSAKVNITYFITKKIQL